MMESESYWTYMVVTLSYQVPAWCALLGGLVAAGIFWSRFPRAALLVVLAVVVLGGTMLVEPSSSLWLMRQRTARAWNIEEFGFYHLAISTALSALHALAYSLLFVAVFVGRHALLVPPSSPTDPRIL